MFTEADGQLTGIEKKMLDMLEQAYTQYADSDGPLPVSLVQLAEKTHKTILARLGKRGGLNMGEMMKNPQEALVQIDKMRELLLRMISQEESMGAVFPFPQRGAPS